MKKFLIIILIGSTCQISYEQNTAKIISYELDTAKVHICKKWNYPNKEMLERIISNMTPLDNITHHDAYHNYSCYISGLILYNGKKYEFIVNAGGWAEFTTPDYSVQFALACTNRKYFKYFIKTYDPAGVSGE